MTPCKFSLDRRSLHISYYQGENIGEREAEFVVLEIPSKDPETATDDPINPGEEGDNPSNPEEELIPLTPYWVGPYLSDYVVHAGKQTDIEATFGVVYVSDEEFTGIVTTEIKKEEEIIQTIDTPVVIAAGVGEYKSGHIATFTTDGLGTYSVTCTLKDSEGKEILSSTKNVEVKDRKKIELIANSNVSTEENRTIDINWNDISNSDESYTYRLYRRYDGEDWTSRSIWNEEEKINVLNVYPAYPYLEGWMTTTISNTESPAGMGMFNIDSVAWWDYNANPEKYMYDENGRWKYDVAFFGSSDGNSGRDLTYHAYEITQKFVDSGRGVLFGHDTVCLNQGSNWNMAKFGDQLGIKVINNTTVWPVGSVSVVTIGTLTNFPWELRGTLNIPYAHSWGQYVGGTLPGIEWMQLNTSRLYDQETGGHSNFYLVTYNNLGMIQTGHSNGQATDDERKVLANTLFYLHQISQVTTAKDNSFYDLAAPDKAKVKFIGIDNDDVSFSLNAKDNGTTYQYYIESIPGSDDSEILKSNIMTQVALSGVKGYVYAISESSEVDPSLVQYDENHEIVQNVFNADEEGALTGSVKINDFNRKNYLHVFTVDNENNVSEELIIPMDEGTIQTEISADKDIYTVGDMAVIDSKTTAIPYTAEGDVSIEVYDSDENFCDELMYESAVQITADEPISYEINWDTTDFEPGEYKIKAIWSDAGEKLTSAVTSVQVQKSVVEIPEEPTTEEVVTPVVTTENKVTTEKVITENQVTTENATTEQTTSGVTTESKTLEQQTTETTKAKETQKTGKVKTGDGTQPWIPASLLFICAVGIVFTIRVKRNENK